MATAYTSLLGLALPVTGELSGSWGDVVNDSITSLLDSAISGTTTLSADADVTLTSSDGVADQARQAILLWTAGGTVTRNITAPAQSKAYFVVNKTSSTQSIVIRGAGPTTGVTVRAGQQALVVWNGVDFVEVASGDVDGPSSATDNAVARFDGTTGKLIQNSVVTIADSTGNMAGVGTLGVGAITTSGALTYGGVTLNNAVTGTGDMVLSTSPTLVTPALGTPSALVGTNITGTAAGLTAGNVTTNANLTGAITSTGNATLLGSFSSANLAGALTDETGTGSAVFANSPTLVTPALGTPASGVVTNLTGTASININGTVGATTASTGAFTTLTTSSTVTVNGGTANGVAYLNGSKVLTTGSALTFDGTNLAVGTTTYSSIGGSLSTLSLGGTNTTVSGGIAYQVNGSVKAYHYVENNVFNHQAQSGVSQAFLVNGSEQMRLTSTGLGIGTSSPAYKLHISGSGAQAAQVTSTSGSASLILQNFTGAGNYAYIQYNGHSGSGLQFYDTANVAARMTLDSSGNLGLGVTPSAWGSDYKALQIQGASFGQISTDNGVASMGANLYRDSGGAYRFVGTGRATQYQQAAGQHFWFTTGTTSGTAGDAISFTQSMTLDSSGNLGVGTTSPSVRLDVSTGADGNIAAFRGASSAGLSIATGTFAGTALSAKVTHTSGNRNVGIGTPSGDGVLFFETNAAERARITSGGELLVGLASATGVALLQVSGPIRTTGYTVATLPAGTVGMRTYVTDALAPAFGVAVAGSGAVTIPVFYDGANWIVA
jgi:hypothetical protein